jgi:Lrp/AsnC family leucine-responsive transcriptional regulator
MIDDTDRRILSILQEDARTPVSVISRQAGVEPAAVSDRLRELERRGVIRGYHVEVSPRESGFDLTAFVFVRTDWRSDVRETAKRLAQIPEALEVHRVAGEDCYLVKVKAHGIEGLGRLLREKFDTIESIISTEATVVLKTVKETAALPLDSASLRPAEL